jgi:hypothetical protein
VLSGPIGARSCQTYVRHTAVSIEGTLKQLACDVIYQSNKLWDELGTGAVLCNEFFGWPNLEPRTEVLSD